MIFLIALVIMLCVIVALSINLRHSKRALAKSEASIEDLMRRLRIYQWRLGDLIDDDTGSQALSDHNGEPTWNFYCAHWSDIENSLRAIPFEVVSLEKCLWPSTLDGSVVAGRLTQVEASSVVEGYNF